LVDEISYFGKQLKNKDNIPLSTPALLSHLKHLKELTKLSCKLFAITATENISAPVLKIFFKKSFHWMKSYISLDNFLKDCLEVNPSSTKEICNLINKGRENFNSKIDFASRNNGELMKKTLNLKTLINEWPYHYKKIFSKDVEASNISITPLRSRTLSGEFLSQEPIFSDE
jgi:superfamily II DNA helicase RecQ